MIYDLSLSHNYNLTFDNFKSQVLSQYDFEERKNNNNNNNKKNLDDYNSCSD